MNTSYIFFLAFVVAYLLLYFIFRKRKLFQAEWMDLTRLSVACFAGGFFSCDYFFADPTTNTALLALLFTAGALVQLIALLRKK